MSGSVGREAAPDEAAPSTGTRPGIPSGSVTARRPQLDGLRTVAVYLVVLFHCGVGWASGGFIGVDVFFVLSGYLVTGVLVRGHEAHGHIRFGHFYARRVRRLLPAALLTLLATTATFAVLSTPVEVQATGRAARASLLYVANWFFVVESTDYFADDVSSNPLLHFWSLAVEEQFYVLWPLALAGALMLARRLGPRFRRLPLGLVAVVAVGSLIWALGLRHGQPNRAYFGTDARAYQLLVGALLAMAPSVVARAGRRSRLAATMAPIGLIVVVVAASSALSVDPIVRGVLVTVASVVVLVGLEAAPHGIGGRLLATAPISYLGRISYGTYLWHWPLVVALDRLIDLGPAGRVAVVGVLATALASLSHSLVEQPVQMSRFLDRIPASTVVGAGLVVSVVAAFLIVPRVVDSSSPRPADVAGPVGFTPVPADYDERTVYMEGFGRLVDCVDASPDLCTVVEGSGRHLLLIGDSNAQMMIPAFTKLAEAEDLTLSLAVTAGCPWQRGEYVLTEEIRTGCRRAKEDAYERTVPVLDPDVVVAINARPRMGPSEYDPGSERARGLHDRTWSSVEELSDGGRRQVILLEPAPRSSVDPALKPRTCLAEATYVEECRFVADVEERWEVDLLREVAESSSNVVFVETGRLFCPFLPICDPVIDGTPVYWNAIHISRRYSEAMAGPLADLLRSHGVLDS